MTPPNFAADAPVSLADRINNGGRAPQEEPDCATMPPPPVMAGSGDPEKGS